MKNFKLALSGLILAAALIAIFLGVGFFILMAIYPETREANPFTYAHYYIFGGCLAIGLLVAWLVNK